MITSPPVLRLNRVRITNYRSIAEGDVTLGPLTVLVGPNGGGKTSFVDAFRFVAEALATSPTQAADARGGIAAVLRRVPEPTKSLTISLDLSVKLDGVPAEANYAFALRRGDRGAVEVAREDCRLRWADGTAEFRVDGCEVSDSTCTSPEPLRIEPDRLYLQVAGTRRPWSAIARRLSAMRFYDLDPRKLRRPYPDVENPVLGRAGEHLGPVIGDLADRHPAAKERVDEYLSAVVPGTTSVSRRRVSDRVTVEMRQTYGAGREVVLGPGGMPDGAVRMLGVLAALFQPAVVSGQVPLVGVAEPEAALHPSAAAVLLDALTEASARLQVIVTTHSANLLDREVDPYDFDPSVIRAVESRHGLTVIGEVNEASLQAIREKRFTAGELMRAGQLYPGGAVRGSAEVAT